MPQVLGPSPRKRGATSLALALSVVLLAVALVVTGFVTVPRRLSQSREAAMAATRINGVRDLLRDDMNRLDTALARILAASDRNAANAAARAARRPFRELEVLLARYGPAVLSDLNSDETSAVDEDPADGFKVRRGFLLLDSVFADPQASDSSWRDEVRRMRLQASRFRPTIELVAPTEREVFDLARTELARTSTLTITGFDAGPDDALGDAAAAVQGIATLLARSQVGDSALQRQLASTESFLTSAPSFNDFDRYTFVHDYVNPAFAELAAERRTIPGPSPPLVATWHADAGSVYDAKAFDVMSYAPSNALPLTDAWVALGRRLFFDTRLSDSGDRSCATCHVPELAFRDGRARAVARPGANQRSAALLRHTPTLINVGLQPSQFVDGRRSTLEQQIADVLTNPREMGSDFQAVVRRVGQDSLTLVSSIAAYLRTLRALDSPFDRAMRGEADLDPAARRGFNLFMGRANCGTCHFAPLFSGTQPPGFNHSEPEVIDVPQPPGESQDRDLGRGAVDRRSGLVRAFKTPTVRNVAITPNGFFMHNGVFKSLNDVLDFYDAGGRATAVAGPAPRARNVTLPPDSLHLTTTERADLLAFLASLSDTVGTTRRP